MVDKPGFGSLNSAEHSQEPESSEPDDLNGLDLIIKNNQNTTKPNVITKIVGPLRGQVFFAAGDPSPFIVKKESNGIDFFSFFGSNDIVKHRIRIPEMHSHLPDLGEDLSNVPPSIAFLYPEFIAQTTEVKSVSAGTIVWCNFLDRENYRDPVYLGPVDDKKTNNSGGSTVDSIIGSFAGLINSLRGSPAAGDLFGGVSYKNAAGQVSYPAAASSWTGELPVNGFTATTATVEDLITLAKKQIGTKEAPVGTNSGPIVDKYNGRRAEAWNSAGLAWLFRTVGAPLPGDKIPYPTPSGVEKFSREDVGWNKIHSILTLKSYFETLNSFYAEPSLADIVVYSVNNNAELVDSLMHVGLVIEIDGDIIKTIEFNLHDEVATVTKNWKTSEIINKDSSRQKGDLIVGFARRPLPYTGVVGGQLIQQPASLIAGSNFEFGANHPYYETVLESKNNPEPSAQTEMVFVDQTKRILYPRKYIRSLETMRNAYKNSTGKTLTIVSGYRSVELQRDMYQDYLARGKMDPQVAPPGKSLHNSGKAIDISMSTNGINWSAIYAQISKPEKEQAHLRAIAGEFGPTAKWLVENGKNFGYEWIGYSFRELWHYELQVNVARSLGLLDE